MMTTTDLPIDPWSNRSEGMRCRTCIWFMPKDPGYGADVGRCRRHAPTMGGYPVVLQSDWCGDHRLNERVRAADLKEQEALEMRRQEQDAMAAAVGAALATPKEHLELRNAIAADRSHQAQEAA